MHSADNLHDTLITYLPTFKNYNNEPFYKQPFCFKSNNKAIKKMVMVVVLVEKMILI